MMRHAFPHAIGVRADSLREYAARWLSNIRGTRRPDARIRRRSQLHAPTTFERQLRAMRTIEYASSPMTAIGMSHQTT